MQAYTLWYTRKDGEIRGPFPRAVIAQYLLLSRLRKEDEVSVDQKHWQPIYTIDELIPAVMKADLTDPNNEKRLKLAKRGADERLALDRRKEGDGAESEELRNSERRGPEAEDELEHRKIKTEIIVEARKAQPTNTVLAVVIVLAIAGILLALALNYKPQPSEPDADCAAAPVAGVNWNNCNLQGGSFDRSNLQQALARSADLTGGSFLSANLQGADFAFANLSLTNMQHANLHNARLLGVKLNSADLTGADLSGADLSYADLSSANLTGANLEGANLNQAVWIDKTICARGSVGSCLSGR